MGKKIVVAYDGTREGRTGLFRFTETLPQTDAEIHLLAVIRLPSGAFLAEGYIPEAVIDEEKQRYQEIVQEGTQLLAQRGYRVTSHLEFGDPIEEIVRLARQLPADLIVVGHKRQSSLAARWWGSSVGASLLERSPCSILVAVCD
ncbi:MAG TPA: universal stress protein [Burkholderiales bacterium]|nr:universal stress protein [Burkholderiales bacterium]